MTIRVVKPGFFTTVQDRGRYGFAHLGISPAGAADALSLRIANLLVGNDEYAPALEMTLLGATLEFEESAIVAISGANADCKLGPELASAEQGNSRSQRVQSYNVGVPRTGPAATWQSRADSTSRSSWAARPPTCEGVSEASRDAGCRAAMYCECARATPQKFAACMTGVLEAVHPSGPVRVTRGAQHDWFSPETYAKLLSSPYLVSEQSDRAGLRLQGEAISPSETSQLLTDGIPLGAIQVPQDGQPIILFVDQQTTGWISQDRQRHRRRHASHRATATARPGAVCRGFHRGSGRGAARAGALAEGDFVT